MTIKFVSIYVNTIEKTFKWKTLEHNGVAFPPNHILKGISIGINNERLAH